jgi:hypothetical protein
MMHISFFYYLNLLANLAPFQHQYTSTPDFFSVGRQQLSWELGLVSFAMR